MKTVIIKTRKRKNNIRREYLQLEIQKKLFPDELMGKVILTKINLEYIELTVKEENLNLLLDYILKYKLNDNFYIDKEKVIIKEIKLSSDSKDNFYQLGQFKINNNRLTIIFKTPVIFKVGYNFLDFSLQLLFQLSLKKYNKFIGENLKLSLSKDELEKIFLIREEIEKFDMNSFMGEIEIDFSKISNETKKKYELLLNFMKLNGVGYKYKEHYGLIELI